MAVVVAANAAAVDHGRPVYRSSAKMHAEWKATTMLDFCELSADGQDLELIVREILLKKGLIAHWSGKGPDGGRDLICTERQDSFFLPSDRRWLVQCKHNAISGKAVGVKDLDSVVDSCQQHACTGYVLACSTYPSSAVVQRLEAITANSNLALVATYWDAVRIEQLLSTPSNWSLAQRFFPASADAWKVYATDRPNQWIVIYKSYYFHLLNRIGSQNEFHLESIKKRVEDIDRSRSLQTIFFVSEGCITTTKMGRTGGTSITCIPTIRTPLRALATSNMSWETAMFWKTGSHMLSR